MKKNLFKFAVLLLIPLFTFPSSVFAVGSSGFENVSYSAKTLGQGNAVIARPQDGSTVLFNPAGIVELPGIQTNLGLQGLDWRIFHANRATGDFNQNVMKLLLIPSFYVTANPGKLLDNRFAFGVGVNSPFGLANTFPSISVARYVGYKNSLRTVGTTFAGSVKLTEWLNVGAGAVNYWIYDYGQIFNYPNAFLTGVAGAADGKVLTDTHGFGWGWNFGILLKPHPKHRLAFSFRSKADVDVHGRLVIDDIFLPVAQGFPNNPHFETGIHSDIQIPANITIGYAYVPSEKWSAEFDFGITQWEVFKDQDFDFDQPNATLRALGTIPRDYNTTISIHLGGHRQINKKWDAYGGFGFYEAASPKKHVDNFLPDANRYFWTFGTSYQLTERARIDLSYLFMLFSSRRISNPQTGVAKSGVSIDGRYTSILHGAFVTYVYQFDFPFEKETANNIEASTVKTV